MTILISDKIDFKTKIILHVTPRMRSVRKGETIFQREKERKNIDNQEKGAVTAEKHGEMER
jgi:hypothetical protein